MHKLLVPACKYQDFAPIQKKIARSHDRETVTFINSDRQTDRQAGIAAGMDFLIKCLKASW